MSKFQDWCKEILSAVQAAANGEEIEYRCGSGWLKKDDSGFRFGGEYRVKPRTIRIGDYDVPEPMREAPEKGVVYFVPSVSNGAYKFRFANDLADKKYLLNGVAHLDESSALMHGKALISLTSMEK